MKKFFAMLLTLAVFMTIFAMPAMAYAERVGLYYVNTESTTLRLRNGPGLDYEVIHKLNRGEVVYVAGFDGNWAQVTTLDDDSYVGYASADYLKFYNDEGGAPKVTKPPKSEESVTYEGTTQYVVNNKVTRHLNVRAYAGTQYDKVGKLYQGDTVSVAKISKGWAKIIYYDRYAYVASEYLTRKGKAYDTSTGTGTYEVRVDANSYLNLRAGPGTEYEAIGKAYRGDYVEVIERYYQWCKIVIDGNTCYVKSDYIRPVR